MAEHNLTPEMLRDILAYKDDSGDLFWIASARGGFHGSVLIHAAGDVAGCRRNDGRCVIRVGNKLFLRSRLVWAIKTGQWPSKEVDHIDGDCSNDRFENLRDVGREINQQNIRKALAHKESCSTLGVYIDHRKSIKKWRAAITVAGVQKSLGYFRTEEEASKAYVDAKRAMHAGCTI